MVLPWSRVIRAIDATITSEATITWVGRFLAINCKQRPG